MSEDALAQARSALAELTEAARKGQIIPVRLTGQLEAIAALLEKAETEGAAAASSPDLDGFRTEFGKLLSHGFHDLRLPLTSIRGYGDMLANPAMGTLTEMQQQFLGTMRSNTKRMEALLMDVSDLSKLWNGLLKPAPKMDAFKNIAQIIEKAMRPVATELNRQLEFDVPSGLPLLMVDTELLVKAINKLVENGLRYSEAETGRVVIRAAGEGSQLLIQIEDNGIGMTPDVLEKLGTPYFRADHDLVLSYKGSGLGVAIAYGMLDLLGGQVSVSSQPDQGSSFTIRLAGMV
ncbi:MAG: HAMP domain-containing histidine kinase [Anaerolineae bacterium]|nr:HAMP domain-containing histidine kinase [Anaerolineae bacterium]